MALLQAGIQQDALPRPAEQNGWLPQKGSENAA